MTRDGGSLSSALASTLAARRCWIAEAAAARGYYGIAGIDAFCFVGPEGQPGAAADRRAECALYDGDGGGWAVAAAQQAGLVPAGAWAFLLKAPQGGLSDRIGCVSPCERGRRCSGRRRRASWIASVLSRKVFTNWAADAPCLEKVLLHGWGPGRDSFFRRGVEK